MTKFNEDYVAVVKAHLGEEFTRYEYDRLREELGAENLVTLDTLRKHVELTREERTSRKEWSVEDLVDLVNYNSGYEAEFPTFEVVDGKVYEVNTWHVWKF